MQVTKSKRKNIEVQKRDKNDAVIKSENSKIYLRKKKTGNIWTDHARKLGEIIKDTDIKTLKHKDLKSS